VVKPSCQIDPLLNIVANETISDQNWIWKYL